MKVTIDLPDSLLKELSFGFTDLEREIKFLLAVKLVEMGRYGLSAFPLNERTLEQDILDARKSVC
ncbi:MAG: hypothetical protein AAB116_13585 [Candidatus Poribacteria bacterium]